MKNNKNNKNIGHPFNTITSISIQRVYHCVFFPKIEHTYTYRQTKRAKEKKPTAFV